MFRGDCFGPSSTRQMVVPSWLSLSAAHTRCRFHFRTLDALGGAIIRAVPQSLRVNYSDSWQTDIRAPRAE